MGIFDRRVRVVFGGSVKSLDGGFLRFADLRVLSELGMLSAMCLAELGDPRCHGPRPAPTIAAHGTQIGAYR